MKLRVANSGSSGNCYALYSDSGRILLLDCGVSTKEIKKLVEWKTSSIDGCLVTHIHSDHLKPKTEDDLSLMGIYVCKAYAVNGRSTLHEYIGDFETYSFNVPHDGTPCVGYMINVDKKVVLYITDAEYIKWNFERFKPHTIIIECNYQEEYVDMDEQKSAHVFRGHMSLKTCIDFLKANQTDALKNVVLCHLSRDNADPNECITAVSEALPDVTVSVASKGMEIEL